MRTWLLPLALALVAPAAVRAQPGPEDPGPTVLKLRPAAAPVPALKYRIVPELRRLEPGNAAIYYHRAAQIGFDLRPAVPAAEPGRPRPESDDEKIARWSTDPLDKLPKDEARKLIERYATVLREIELGAIRRDCDWELGARAEILSLMLPEIQNMRSLARLVSLRIRLAIVEGKTDEAAHWLETGYAMARHVGDEAPLLIQGLVGLAIGNVMTKQLEELMQAPGTPSLYWALANRPRPLVGVGRSLEGERRMLERELPELDELDRSVWSQEQAREFVDELVAKISGLSGQGSPNSGPLRQAGQRLAMAAMLTKVYPEAKAALIAAGRPAAQVEAMPTVQVAALYTVGEYARVRDDLYKWTGLPFWQAQAGIRQAEKFFRPEDRSSNPIMMLFSLLVPAINSARVAEVRSERMLDALQAIEAIRLHAAAHDGALPESLEAITEAPCPLDPATGRPFEYHKLDDATATLAAPLIPGAPEHASYMLRYRLVVER